MRKKNGRWFAKKGGSWNTFSSGSLLACIEKARLGSLNVILTGIVYFWINRRLSFCVRFKEGFSPLERCAVRDFGLFEGVLE
jgi:hypothetical protein